MKRVITLTISFIFMPIIASAQLPNLPLNPGSGVGGEFDSDYASIIEGELEDKPADPKSEFFGYTHTDDLSSSPSTIHLNPKNCTGGGCSVLEGGFIAGSKKVPLGALIPGVLKGHSAYLWNQNLTSMSQANLNSPAVVWATSMFLAEPAVAQGAQNAAMLAAAMNQAGYLEHIGFNAMAENVQGAKPALEAYNWCIHQALKDGKGLAKARIICGKDNGTVATQASTPLSGAGVPRGFQYKDMPAKTVVAGVPVDTEPGKVLLSDIIFNEEAINAGMMLGGLRLVQLKDSFKNLYGDIEFDNQLSAAARTAILAGSDMIPDVDSTIEQSYRVVKPTTAADVFYQDIIVYKFNALRQVLFKHCDEMQSPSLNNSRDLQVNKLSVSTGPVALGDEITMDDIKALSIPGFTMNGAGLVGLRNWYRDVFYVPGMVAGLGGSVNCEPLQNSGNYMVGIPFGPQVAGFNPFDSFNDQLNGLPGREFFVMLYSTAKLLALGEWLAKASLAEQLLNNLSSGIQQGQVFSEMARTLVYKAAGTDDIRGSLFATAQQLRQSFLRVYERQDSAGESAAQKGSQISR